MRHISNIPAMTTRHNILQLKYTFRSTYQPPDTLLSIITPLLPPSLPRHPRSLWHQLLTTPHSSQFLLDPTITKTKEITRQLHINHLRLLQQSTKLINSCRPRPGLDPIMTIPMAKATRSKILRWRLGWLPTGYNNICRCGSPLTRTHTIDCLHMHHRLNIQRTTTTDPISFLLNKLSHSPPQSHATINRWKRCWPILTSILLELELLQHPLHIEPPTDSNSDPFLDWLLSSPWLTTNPLPPPLQW